MKKFLIAIAACFSCVCANAEDILAVTPIKITADKAVEGADGYFTIELNNDDMLIKDVSFDLYLPEGMKIYTNKSGNLVSSSMALNTARTSYYDEDEEDDVTAFGSASGGNLIKDDFGVDCYRWGGVGQFPVAGTNGVLFNARYKMASTLSEGVYPIKLAINIKDVDGVTVKTTTNSYVVVGNPEKQTLALEGVTASFVNEALATETAISTLDMSAVTAVNGDFTYVAGRSVLAPAAFPVAANVKFTSTTSNTYSSICLPYNATVDCYTLSGVSGATANFTSATALTAGTSAIVKGNVNLDLGEQTLVTVEKNTITKGYYLKADNLYEVNNSANIPALRGCWTAAAGIKSFTLDGELATGINGISMDENATIYSVAGQRLNKTQKGVNIVNGKKVLVK